MLRRLSAAAAGHPGVSVSDDVLRWGDRWSTFCTGIRSPTPRSASARPTSRSPEYWVHHMGREKALSAALQLQHDAGLILSKVLQQLVTALNRNRRTFCGQSTVVSHFRWRLCNKWYHHTESVARRTIWWRWVCGARQSPLRSEDNSRRQQCLHVLPWLLPGGAYVSRGAKWTLQWLLLNNIFTFHVV